MPLLFYGESDGWSSLEEKVEGGVAAVGVHLPGISSCQFEFGGKTRDSGDNFSIYVPSLRIEDLLTFTSGGSKMRFFL